MAHPGVDQVFAGVTHTFWHRDGNMTGLGRAANPYRLLRTEQTTQSSLARYQHVPRG